MSHQEPEEDNQVDFIPDTAETGNDEQPAMRSCKNCFRSDVCYAYYKMLNLEAEYKNLKWITMPFKPEILATDCELFLPKRNVKMVDMEKEDTEEKED